MASGFFDPRPESDGGGALASIAEGRRRAGELDLALRLANEAMERDPSDVAARVTAALASLDLGFDADARRLLEALVAAAPTPHEEAEEEGEALELDALADDELDIAFAEAEPEATAMHDANQVAYDAIRAAALDTPEGIAPAAPDSPFLTRTMAALLEQQGDAAAAHTIRAALERGQDQDSQRTGRRRDDRIRVLEQWLERTRRGTA